MKDLFNLLHAQDEVADFDAINIAPEKGVRPIFRNLVRVVDPHGNTITNTYDLRGRKTAMNDPDMGAWSYAYNGLGELVSQRDAKNQLLTLSYDLLGRMSQRSEPEGVTQWVYDSVWKGALTEVTAPGGYKRSHAYDGLGRAANAQYTIAGEPYAFSYTYDAQSRVKDITYPTGFTVTNSYNSRGYLYEVGKPYYVYWRLQATDARGQWEQFIYSNALGDTLRSHDPATGYLTAIVTNAVGKPSVQSLNYSWDALGNLVSRTDQLQGGLKETFDYDNVNRLTRTRVHPVSGNPSTDQTDITVAYDAIGNITYKSDMGAYTYGAKPHAVTATNGNFNTTFTHDANGNVTYGQNRYQSLAWTSYNLPSRIERCLFICDSAVFNYGPERERTQQINTSVGRVTTITYVSGLYERHTIAGVAEHKHYIRAGNETIAIDNDNPKGLGKIRYLHHDHRDSVDVVTDTAGVAVERLAYDAWGKRRAVNWLNVWDLSRVLHETHYGYTGHEHLDNIEVIHMNGRVYDPYTARFISADPIIQAPGDIQSYNRYSYVRNNPLTLIDPSGFSWWGKQVNRFGRETRRWEGDFRHEIRRPGSLLGPAIQIVGAVVATIVCVNPACGAAVVGAVSAGTARAQGASDREALKAGAVSGASAYAFAQIGAGYQSGAINGVERVVLHGVVGGAASVANGGDFGSGFLSGSFSAAANPYVPQNPVVGAIASAVIGGTASELGGGKFANGAVTGAFAYAFGNLAQRGQERGGSPLPDNVKEALGPYFEGFDLGGIRTHEGIPGYVIGEPNAFTMNQEIYFAPGAYDPNSASGIALIGHEVLHAQDFSRLGTAGMGARYVGEYLGGRLSGMNHHQAYMNISYERSGYALQYRIRDDLIRSGYPR